MRLLDEFVAAFEVWEEARPYLHMMVDEQEMQLVVAMQDKPVTVNEVADLLDMTPGQAADLLQRSYSRCMVNKAVEDEALIFSAADFYTRLDHFAKFENWDDIPAAGRRAIDRRFLDEFIARHRRNVERKMRGLAAENALPNDAILLVGEVEEMIDAARHIVVQPCDCRRLGQNCELPVDTCMWFDEGALAALDRGHGKRLTKEQAKELIRWTDRKGLMHTADSEWQTRGLHAVCNCCACDCYPFRAAQELGSKGVWPRSRYIALHDQQQCNLCGACIKRCHFGAFRHAVSAVGIDGTASKDISFDPHKCWGCGLCANTCPSGAIVMVKL